MDHFCQLDVSRKAFEVVGKSYSPRFAFHRRGQCNVAVIGCELSQFGRRLHPRRRSKRMIREGYDQQGENGISRCLTGKVQRGEDSPARVGWGSSSERGLHGLVPRPARRAHYYWLIYWKSCEPGGVPHNPQENSVSLWDSPLSAAPHRAT